MNNFLQIFYIFFFYFVIFFITNRKTSLVLTQILSLFRMFLPLMNSYLALPNPELSWNYLRKWHIDSLRKKSDIFIYLLQRSGQTCSYYSAKDSIDMRGWPQFIRNKCNNYVRIVNIHWNYDCSQEILIGHLSTKFSCHISSKTIPWPLFNDIILTLHS